MFNLYQTLNKKEEGDSPRRRVSDVTGHDRFYQERPRSRRKRRPISRRTRSATEFDSDAMVTARSTNAVTRRNRSASIESTDDNDDGFQLTNKIDSLAKILFNRVSVAKANRDNDIKNGKNQYESLGQSASIKNDSGECMELEIRRKTRALVICEIYTKRSDRYSVIKQLSPLGSRIDKNWFAVRDELLKTDRVLTMVPLNRFCPVIVTPSTREILNKLFLALQHPYVCPVFDSEFIDFESNKYIIMVQPINQGSLKDLIYGIERNCWNADWGVKYASRGNGLALHQIQRLGRQILEALIFLRERGFPTVTHLHSGNVLIQNGVARIAGLENSLFGFTSRIHSIITSKYVPKNSIDCICFGYMLFEMCTGYELCSFQPSPVHMADLDKYPLVADLMKLIFNQPGYYPSIEELLIHDLFRNIDLREMRHAPATMFAPIVTPSIVGLLEGVKRHNSSRSNCANRELAY